MSYQSFATKWMGKITNPDKVFGYQCVDLVVEYMHDEFGIPVGGYGNAIDYWYRTSSVVLKKFIKVPGSAAKQGDIVILSGINGNPDGHIGIASGKTNLLTVEILEQNGSTGTGHGTGGDVIRLRSVPRWRIVGLLRPAPVAAPAASYYVVRAGDTVTKICLANKITIDRFKEMNPGIKNIDRVTVGERVRVK